MKIGLVDVDGHNFPNIALMKIASWHRQQGDTLANRAWLFKSMDFMDYEPRKGFKCSEYFE